MSSGALAQGVPEREYIYTTSHQAHQVSGFAVDPANGALTPVPGSPVASIGAYLPVGDGKRRSVYVVSVDGGLARFNLDPDTGALAATPPATVPGHPEQGADVHPWLPILYATDALFLAVRVYRVNEPCCIVQIGVTPVANNVHGAAVHPSGKFLYLTTSFDNIAGNSSHLWGFAIDQVTGLLTPLPGSPWLEGIDKSTAEVKIDPPGRYLYAVNRLGNEITGYAIDGLTGLLTRLAGAPFPAGGRTDHLALSDSGQFLFASLGATASIAAFTIQANGHLAPVTGSPFATIAGPASLVTAGGDSFLYVTSGLAEVVGGHAIDYATGALSPLPGAPFAGRSGQGIARVRMTPLIPPPTMSVDDAAVTEGHAGFVQAAFTVRLANGVAGTATVDYETSSGTAQEPDDYLPASGTLTFPPGVVTLQAFVTVRGDVLDEPDEFFSLVLSEPAGATLGRAEGYVRIRDDDGETMRLSSLDRDADQVADLQALPGPAVHHDQYLLRREPWTSHEVVVDAASGDLGDAGPYVDLLFGDSSSVIPSAPLGTGSARTLRLTNDASSPRLDYVRVRSLGCSLDCGPDDTYRIRLRETTGRIPRFNESGGQVTVLVLQNRTDTPLLAHASYWGPIGERLAGTTIGLAPKGSTVVFTPPSARGASGSITVSHDGSLGALAGKAVALDPATGLAFDTPLETRPR